MTENMSQRVFGVRLDGPRPARRLTGRHPSPAASAGNQPALASSGDVPTERRQAGKSTSGSGRVRCGRSGWDASATV
jgi:hypothetical protein